MIWMDDAIRDLQYAIRTLRRQRGFMLVVALTLALGIGANTAVFSVVHGVLIRPLPYVKSAQLVRVWENVPGTEIGNGRGPGIRQGAMDVADTLAVRSRARTLTNIAAFGIVRPIAVMDGDITRMEGFSVSAGFFPMLGVSPILGRTFTPEETVAGRGHVVVLGYEAWQRFGGSVGVLGRSVVFRGEAGNPLVRGVDLDVRYVVIGVMPRGFRFPHEIAEFWVPRPLTPSATGRPTRLETVARLADGATSTAAAAEMEAIRRETHPAASSIGAATGVRPRYELIPIHDELTRPVRPALLVLTVAVGVVLLIACVNVTSLLLARTASRQREMAVRSAIGAGPGRLMRQLFTESVVLAAVGGVAGIAVALALLRVFRLLGTTLGRADLGLQSVFPRLGEVTLDSAVLAYAVVISLGTAVFFGLAPAVREALRREGTLRESALPRTRLRNALVVVEIALATPLLVAAGLMITSFVKLATVDPGFDPAHLLTFQIGLSSSRTQEELRTFAEEFVARVRKLPYVQSAAYARQLPMVQLQDALTITVRRDGVAQLVRATPDTDIRFVSHDYLNTMGIRVLSGRALRDGDGGGRPGVVVINETLARRAFAGTNPVGEVLLFGAPGHQIPLEIVGVVNDVRQFGLDQPPEPQYFMDIRQVPTDPAFRAPPLFPLGVYYTVRTNADVGPVVGGIRTIARQLDTHATVDEVATMEQIVSNSITRPRMYTVLVGIFGAVAFTLAVVGLYGVMAYSVAQRTREIGVRVALGAERADVMRLVLRQSLALTAAGILAGVAAAAVVSRFLESLLFDVRPLDGRTFAAAALAFAAVAMLASYVPARRAATVDPLIALRHE